MNLGWRLYLDRLHEMTWAEWKLREQSSLYGFLWTLLQPALMFVVLYGLFTKWMGHHVRGYPTYLLIGILQYGFFNSATTYGLDSLRRRSGVVLNFIVPRETLVLCAVLSVAASHLIELALMLVFALVLGASPSPAWLAVGMIALAQVVMTCGLCLFLAAAAARWHDLPRIWSVLTTAGFFLTPIFYSLSTLSPSRQRALWLNPLTHIIELTRACVLDGRWPSAPALAGLTLGSLALFSAGYALFKSVEGSLGDHVAA